MHSQFTLFATVLYGINASGVSGNHMVNVDASLPRADASSRQCRPTVALLQISEP